MLSSLFITLVARQETDRVLNGALKSRRSSQCVHIKKTTQECAKQSKRDEREKFKPSTLAKDHT